MSVVTLGRSLLVKSLLTDDQDPDFDFQAWLDKHMKFSHPATPKWNAEVKAKDGGDGKKFACVGYCQ